MKIKRYGNLLIILISAFSLGYIVLKPAFNYLASYLSKSEQVKANILVVEGWLPDNAIELAYNEFQKNRYEFIITTGMKIDAPYFNLSENGFLIFYLKGKLSAISTSSPHSIEVDAFSEVGEINASHFNLYINDSLAGDFFAEKRKKLFGVNWEGNLKDIDSIMVEFNNDSWGDFGDRNLYVKEIIIDHIIYIPYQNNSIYDVLRQDGHQRIINNFDSNAELAKNQLFFLGVDSSLIKAVPAKKVRINRTLTSALTFRNWLKTSKIDIKGINIISMGTHARRTWMTYNKILKEKYDIGIISLPDNISKNSNLRKTFRTIRETLGIIYYWIILIPY
jgi:hypothetical protein